MLIEIESVKELTAIQYYLTKLLKTKGYSGTDIAYKLGVTPACISQYLNDKRGGSIPLTQVQKKVSKLSIKLIKDKESKLLTMLKVK